MMLLGHKNNLTPTKSPSKLKPDDSPDKRGHEPCKVYESPQKPNYLETSVENVSPTKVDIVREDRPLYNKENLLRRLEAVETNVDCSPLHDSGYSSILHSDSQCQDDDDFSSCSPSIPLFETPKQTLLDEKPVPVSCTSSLPVLRFEEVVCSTLKKSSKRCPKVDWDTVEEVVSHGAFGLDKLIGKKMGLEKLDILGELFQRDFKHLLSKILRHLSAIDLINVISVSTTWRKILQRDNCAYSVYKQCHKEICEKEARKSEFAATRDSSLFRLPLAPVQKVASALFSVSKKKSNKKNKQAIPCSRLSEFNEVGKTLINDQSLKVCRDCGSPSKYDSLLHRAICTRESCQLDFCTLCNCEFHFSKDCVNIRSRNHRYLSDTLPGSKKSKQNLRRL
ncbi:peptide chain release factor 1-like, mitochondrial isoform X2 [Pseudophryne corroboree]|uniref:peptide chain release factor 1-like, mitochondrial isoform X2 n=1 Tax=Pseudophryne corroboree TaxID=495146 RepID=UPI0030812819